MLILNTSNLTNLNIFFFLHLFKKINIINFFFFFRKINFLNIKKLPINNKIKIIKKKKKINKLTFKETLIKKKLSIINIFKKKKNINNFFLLMALKNALKINHFHISKIFKSLNYKKINLIGNMISKFHWNPLNNNLLVLPKFVSVNEKNKSNQNTDLIKIKKKKTKVFFNKLIISSFLYLKKRKNLNNTFFKKIKNLISIKSNTYSKYQINKYYFFLNNFDAVRRIRIKSNNLIENAYILQQTYNKIFILSKKKILRKRNYLNKQLIKKSKNILFFSIKKKYKLKKISFFISLTNFFNKNILNSFNCETSNKFFYFKNIFKIKNLLTFKLIKKQAKKNIYFFNLIKLKFTKIKKKPLKKINKKPLKINKLFIKKKKNMKKKINKFFLLRKKKINIFSFRKFYLLSKTLTNPIFFNLKRKKINYLSYKNLIKKIIFLSKKINNAFLFSITSRFRINFFNKHNVRFLKKNFRKYKKFFYFSNFFKNNKKKKNLNLNLYFINKNNKKKKNLNLNFLLKNKIKILKNKTKKKNNTKPSVINFFKIKINTKIDFFFKHSCNGFLFLTKKNYNNYYKITNHHRYKKLIYSFLNRNELQRYILKKYMRSYSVFKFINQKNLKNLNFFSSELSVKGLQPVYYPQIPLSNDWFGDILVKNFTNKDWISLEKKMLYTKTLNENLYNFSIKKIKFKPGYMSIWREARTVLKTTLNLQFRYQKKLTHYLLKYNKFTRNKNFLLINQQLDNVVMCSKVLPNLDSVNLYINNGLIFVNGFVVKNPLFQIFKNDFIQLIVSLKYYILYKWLANVNLFKKIRLKHKTKKKMHSQYLEDDKQKSFNLSNWILNNKNLMLDCSKYLEIDYFTLSIFYLYDLNNLIDINPYSFIETRFNVINLYNWKYIN